MAMKLERLIRRMAELERERDIAVDEQLGSGDFGDFAISSRCAAGRHELGGSGDECISCACACHVSVEDRVAVLWDVYEKNFEAELSKHRPPSQDPDGQ